MYLPADAQDRLFELITSLSAPGSRVAVEAVGKHADERRAETREKFERIAAQLGMEETLDMGELMYDDPDRADVAQWLGEHGWQSNSMTSGSRCAGSPAGCCRRWRQWRGLLVLRHRDQGLTFRAEMRVRPEPLCPTGWLDRTRAGDPRVRKDTTMTTESVAPAAAPATGPTSPAQSASCVKRSRRAGPAAWSGVSSSFRRSRR